MKIVSVNVYGESIQSDSGSGAVIQSEPDAPINLANDADTTNDSQVRFTWSQGSNNGGTTVIDYSVFYDQGNGNFILLEAGVTTEYYLTTTTLTVGQTYSFKV